MDWFILTDGNTVGPTSFDDVLDRAREGRLAKDDLLWSTGMKGWVSAASVPGIWSPPPYQESSPSTEIDKPTSRQRLEIVEPAEAISAPSVGIFESPAIKHRNFFARYWHGDLSLPKSYWLVGIGALLFVTLLGKLFGDLIPELSLPPQQSAAALVAFLLIVLGTVVWQTVGLWRSAGKYIKISKTPGWGWAARILLVLSLVRASADFNQLIWPMLTESWKQARGIEDLPPYQMRLMNSASELEISGGMPFGTAEAFQKLLDAAPTVKVVHLNSIGGRIEEGLRLKKLIRAKGLTTYTSSGCMSACTIAFLGGTPRLISKNAKLGFHSGNFGGVDGKSLPEINERMKEALRESSVPDWFINKAMGTASSEMWYPSSSELVSAKIVSMVVEPDAFAMSGVADWRDADIGEKILATIPLYATLKRYDPEAYQRLARTFTEKIKEGGTPAAARNEIQNNFARQVMPKYLSRAPDTALARYMATQVAEMKALAAIDPKYCVQYLFPHLRDPNLNFVSLLSVQLQQDDANELSNLIEETSKSPMQSVASDGELQTIVAPIVKAHPDIGPVMTNPELHYQEPAKLCLAFQIFYDAILALPPKRSGPVLRLMLNGS